KIALIAPDIEAYWPLLSEALREEGVPTAKAVTIPFHGLPVVQRWLANLRLNLGRVQSGDLELVNFSHSEFPISYERFRQMFTNIYSSEQVLESRWFQGHFRNSLDVNSVMSRDEFVTAVASYWRGSNVEPLEKIVKQLLEDAPSSARFLAEQWFDWLEAWVGK